jgi:hypothetical protein
MIEAARRPVPHAGRDTSPLRSEGDPIRMADDPSRSAERANASTTGRLSGPKLAHSSACTEFVEGLHWVGIRAFREIRGSRRFGFLIHGSSGWGAAPFARGVPMSSTNSGDFNRRNANGRGGCAFELLVRSFTSFRMTSGVHLQSPQSYCPSAAAPGKANAASCRHTAPRSA